MGTNWDYSFRDSLVQPHTRLYIRDIPHQTRIGAYRHYKNTPQDSLIVWYRVAQFAHTPVPASPISS